MFIDVFALPKAPPVIVWMEVYLHTWVEVRRYQAWLERLFAADPRRCIITFRLPLGFRFQATFDPVPRTLITSYFRPPLWYVVTPCPLLAASRHVYWGGARCSQGLVDSWDNPQPEHTRLWVELSWDEFERFLLLPCLQNPLTAGRWRIDASWATLYHFAVQPASFKRWFQALHDLGDHLERQTPSRIHFTPGKRPKGWTYSYEIRP